MSYEEDERRGGHHPERYFPPDNGNARSDRRSSSRQESIGESQEHHRSAESSHRRHIDAHEDEGQKEEGSRAEQQRNRPCHSLAPQGQPAVGEREESNRRQTKNHPHGRARSEGVSLLDGQKEDHGSGSERQAHEPSAHSRTPAVPCQARNQNQRRDQEQFQQ